LNAVRALRPRLNINAIAVGREHDRVEADVRRVVFDDNENQHHENRTNSDDG
jgi:hypothetical protein